MRPNDLQLRLRPKKKRNRNHLQFNFKLEMCHAVTTGHNLLFETAGNVANEKLIENLKKKFETILSPQNHVHSVIGSTQYQSLLP